MAALAVVPSSTPVSSSSLYDIEEHLAALVETMDLVTADQEEQFIADFRQALLTAVDKRDRVGQFLAHCEAQSALADAEIKRLRVRKAAYQHASENLESYVVRIIEERGTPGKKGKTEYPRLEGRTVTFSICACPASVEIVNETAVPAEYKRLTVTLAATAWETMLDTLDLEDRARVLDQVTKAECDVQKTPIKQAIAAGAEVPGARLVTDKHSLRRN